MSLDIKTLTREVYTLMVEEAEREFPPLEVKFRLDELRHMICFDSKNLAPETLGSVVPHSYAQWAKLSLDDVVHLTGIKRNALVLYFLNHVKASNTVHKVELHQGIVYFRP